MEILAASIEDGPEILTLQRLAYQSEAALYGDFSIPPLTEKLVELQAEFGRQLILKAVEDGRIVGSVRGREHEGTCYVGRLIVHPDHQSRGIGTALMYRLERLFPAAVRFELFTGHKSTRNIRLYGRLGYRVLRTQAVSDRLALVFMEKRLCEH